MTQETLALTIYISILMVIGWLSYKKSQSASDFLIGGRSLNAWLTAMSAHASDMSAWLFIALPALIFTTGLFGTWTAIGLAMFMLLNWIIIAPKIRLQTETYNSLTLSSFFESRLHDSSGTIRIFTACISLIFYSIYISAGMIGLGLVLNTLFGINYYLAISIGTLVIIPYLFVGGYTTLAWVDLFQALFLLLMILLVPCVLFQHINGWNSIIFSAESQGIVMSMIPNTSYKTLSTIILSVFGWGLGYFGQPHILTKFMGIRHVSLIKKSMYIGMIWQLLTLSSAIMIGLACIAYFSNTIIDPELVFLTSVKTLFPPLITGFILCGVLGASISTIDSQILVLASSLSEDIYKPLINPNANSQKLLAVSRYSIIFIALFAYIIALLKITTIYNLVWFAWTGLGSSFGPVLIFCLYSKSVNKYGALAGLVTGTLSSLIWPFINTNIPALIPGFLLSCVSIYICSFLTKRYT